MKKTFRLLLAFISLATLSCTDDVEDTGSIVSNTGINLITPNSSFNLVLDGSKLNNLATTFVWDDSENPTGTTMTYTIEAAVSGTDFATTVVLGTTTNHYLDITVGALDTAAKGLGLEPLVEGLMDVRIKETSRVSNFYTLKVTPYQPNWGIIGSATPFGWDNSTAMTFNPLNDTYSITLALTAGEFKFRLDNSWTTNYGDDGNNLSLEAGGANIPVSAGNYTIVLDVNAHTYTITPVTSVWCIIGDAAVDWSTDVLMDYNSITNKYSLIAKLKPGSFKFRLYQDWGNNFGDDGNNLSLDAGGSNISITTAGTYYITTDFTGLSYTITQL